MNGNEMLEALYEADPDIWTEWEAKFIADIQGKGDDFEELFPLQQEKVEELYQKLQELEDE